MMITLSEINQLERVTCLNQDNCTSLELGDLGNDILVCCHRHKVNIKERKLA